MFSLNTFPAYWWVWPALFNNPGIYEIQLEVTAANGCSYENSESVTVYEIPNVNFSIEDVCQGTPSQFTDLTTLNVEDDIVEWIWNFGNGEISNEQNPQFIYIVRKCKIIFSLE